MNPWTLCLLIGSFVPIPQVDIPQSKGVVPTEISSPRRLRVKGTDTDPLMGCRIGSGETGILASDGAQANHDARPGEAHTTAASPATLVTCGTSAVVVKCPSLPEGLKLGPSKLAGVGRARKNIAVRVMDRLQQAEAHESNLHLKQDYRQAWITLSFLQKGRHDAFVQASYVIYGLHPSKVWLSIVADRKSRLGSEYYDWYDSADNLRPDIAKFCPNTADADNHAANEASSANWDGLAGLVPSKERIV